MDAISGRVGGGGGGLRVWNSEECKTPKTREGYNCHKLTYFSMVRFSNTHMHACTHTATAFHATNVTMESKELSRMEFQISMNKLINSPFMELG